MIRRILRVSYQILRTLVSFDTIIVIDRFGQVHPSCSGLPSLKVEVLFETESFRSISIVRENCLWLSQVTLPDL